MAYTIDRRVGGDFDSAVERTTDALEAEGFGVLCDVDVEATLRRKLGEEFRRYRILGACNPELARQALDVELRLGALLPCNVIVYETDDGEVGVSAVDPETLLSVVDNPDLDPIASDVRDRFVRVVDGLAGT